MVEDKEYNLIFPKTRSRSCIVIDGSYGEGGGQILRNSLALSILTRRDLVIENIRANRDNPGLRPQHLAALKGAAQISNAVVEGDELGSSTVSFKPGPVKGGEFTIDIGTAGSITLLLQTLIPPLLSAETESGLTLIGGTDVPWSPPLNCFRNVFLPLVNDLGGDISLHLEKRGFYPKGGGEVSLRIKPSRLRPYSQPEMQSDEDDIHDHISISGTAFVTNLPRHIPERMRDSASKVLRERFGRDVIIDIAIQEDTGIGAGTGITLWTRDPRRSSMAIGSSARGERNISAEKVGENAARKIIREIESGGSTDIFTADQLPILTPLIDRRTMWLQDLSPGNRIINDEINNKNEKWAHGSHLHYTVREISPHLRTSLWVLEQFGFPAETLYEDTFHIII